MVRWSFTVNWLWGFMGQYYNPCRGDAGKGGILMFTCFLWKHRSRNSSGSKVSDYGVRSPAGTKYFSFILWVQTSSGAHPTSCLMGTGGPFPGGKARSGHDADHSLHLVPRSWMSRSYTSSPPSAFMACNGTALLYLLYFFLMETWHLKDCSLVHGLLCTYTSTQRCKSIAVRVNASQLS
jgi:hypothetical protein